MSCFPKYKDLIDNKYLHQPVPKNISLTETEETNLLDIKRFKSGEGYVFFVRNIEDVEYIQMNLQSLLKQACNIEIIYKHDDMKNLLSLVPKILLNPDYPLEIHKKSKITCQQFPFLILVIFARSHFRFSVV